ncbi:hypothetical protein ebA3331 [Aromatoleum aromaticum EbN1]|uniref:Uncharacterized protein n=1 Tax=Aromatoleum aromaticum (strain DSM 19018 / LMG 30748 / EbN1) TaxID=76114 RepID=Q5P3W0_AROAE|nr:hypothetical protein ebA3331 [Aromatoleum aromaticum EbN1]
MSGFDQRLVFAHRHQYGRLGLLAGDDRHVAVVNHPVKLGREVVARIGIGNGSHCCTCS